MGSIRKQKPKDREDFAHRLLDWYAKHAREMPWRTMPVDHANGRRSNPYHVWLSEIMLQQTQVVTVRDYFLKFINAWPTVKDLASAGLEDILKAWAGLGYYSRARNLKKCADLIVSEHGGEFPKTYEELIKLPGIGDYTASAISSIVYDQAVPVIDGNVERVMARHRRIENTFPEAKPETQLMLETLLDKQKPGEFAQAMMDLGATICTPKNPACSLCPINKDCLGYKNGDAYTFPRKKAKAKKPKRVGAAFVIENGAGEIFLCKRPDTGLLASMTQVPTTDWDSRNDGATGIEAQPFPSNWENAGTARHVFTHFELELEVWKTTSDNVANMYGWWCKLGNLEEEALPTVMRKVLERGLS